jgi:hypothetical protein
MIYICCRQLGQRILLLVKIYIINLFIKKYMRTIQSGNMLLVKKCIINLLIKICTRAVQLGNIFVDKNLHKQITSKKLHSQLFIKTSISIFVYCQYINILEDKN